jgi:hypothetical protein
VCSSEGVASTIRAIVREVEALAGALEVVQAGMAAVRDRARAAGLEVVGTVIGEPAPLVAFNTDSTTGGPPPIVAYLEARDRVDALRRQWVTGVSASADVVASQQVTVIQLTRDLVSGGYTTWLRAKLNPVLHDQAAFLADEAIQAADDLDALTSGLQQERITPYAGVYDDMDHLAARSSDEALKDVERYLGKASRHDTVDTTLKGLGPVFAAYGFHDDIQNGESVLQAGTSQGASFVASGAVTAWAAHGAVTGSVAPGVGTVIGAVGGAAAGFAANHVVDRGFQAAHERAEQRQADERERERREDERRVRGLLALQDPDLWKAGAGERTSSRG